MIAECPLCPQKRTFSRGATSVALGRSGHPGGFQFALQQTLGPSFDHSARGEHSAGPAPSLIAIAAASRS